MAAQPIPSKLCDPCRIGPLTLKNRMVKAPFCTVLASKEGFVTDSLLSLYKSIARGGAGLSVVEGTVVDPLGISGCPRLAVYDDKYLPGLERLAAAIRQYDCPAILQLQHAGPAYSSGVYKGRKVTPQKDVRPMAASSLSSAEMPLPEKNPPRGLSLAEVKDIENKFIQAAGRAHKAGFSGVELHAAHHYLLSSFLSRAWNRREDEYGGKVCNRARLVTNIVRGIKERFGGGFLVGVRLNGVEYGSPLGLTIDETQEISGCIQEAGADYLSISGWGFGRFQHLNNLPEQILFPTPPQIEPELLAKFKRPGIFVDLARQIKEVVDLPVITVGRLNARLGQSILQDGKADLVAFARALIADPELPNKAAAGNLDHIVPCTACLTCWDTLEKGEPLRCRVNPAVGREDEFKIKRARLQKRVMVVGGGPAGMACARTAALRGHHVSLYDKKRKLGGLLHTAALIKGQEVEELTPLVDYYRKQLRQAGVLIKLNAEVDNRLIKSLNPEVLVLATGARSGRCDLAVQDKRRLTTSAKLQKMSELPLNLLGHRILGFLTRLWLPLGKRVLIAGGLIQGLETALFLAKRNKKLAIVEPSGQLGAGMPNINRLRLLSWLTQKGVVLLPNATCRHLGGARFEVLEKEGGAQIIEADIALAMTNPLPNDSLLDLDGGIAPERYQVGDCKNPGLIVNAIEDGVRIGMRI
jgi:2,4-dienoyl-CoA reductase (NADPH2)